MRQPGLRICPYHELPSRSSNPFRLVSGLEIRRRHPWDGYPLIFGRTVGLLDHPGRPNALCPVHRRARSETWGSRSDGIQIIDYFTDTNRVIAIERNLIRDNGRAGIGLLDGGTTVEDFRAASVRERITVFHNTLLRNDHGISGGDNLIALNNIFVGHFLALKNVDADSIASHTCSGRTRRTPAGALLLHR